LARKLRFELYDFEIEGFEMPTKRQAASAAKGNKVEPTGMDAVSALDLLEEDHTQVDDLFDKYEQLDSNEEKKELAIKICLALRVHTQIEEEIFYPAVRDAIENTDRIDEAIVEHAAAIQLIAEIEEMDAGDELYDAKVTVLNEQVLHHIEEEEDELFPEVESSGIDLGALGQKLAERKAALLKQMTEQGQSR
jgi:hemerythrin superfamily protein